MTKKERLFSIMLLVGMLALGVALSVKQVSAQVFDFDEGMEVLAEWSHLRSQRGIERREDRRLRDCGE